MANSPKRLCWDACIWIALIQKETIQKGGTIEDRYGMIRPLLDLAISKGTFEIVVSALCLAEVCKNPHAKPKTADAIAKHFEGDHIILVPVDRHVGSLARDIILTQAADGLDHIPRPQDAIHIATALISNADEFNTFDEKLLKLDGKLMKLDGAPLRICRPSERGNDAPLLKGVE